MNKIIDYKIRYKSINPLNMSENSRANDYQEKPQNQKSQVQF